MEEAGAGHHPFTVFKDENLSWSFLVSEDNINQTMHASQKFSTQHWESLQDFWDVLPDMVALVQGGIVCGVNRAGLKLLGATSAAQVIGSRLGDFMEQEQRARFVSAPGDESPVGTSVTHPDINLYRLDGDVVLAEITSTRVVRDGAPAILSIARDASRHQERAQRLSYLEFAAQQSGDILLVFELLGDFERARAGEEDARIIYVNDAYERMTGYTAKETMGRRWLALLGEGALPELISDSQRGLLLGHVTHVELPLDTKRGGVIWVSVTSRMIREDGLGQSHVVSSLRDITFQRKLQAQMMQMERVVAVGSLAAGIGHEINNPLAYVRSNIDYCGERWGELLEVMERFRREQGEAYLDAQLHRDLRQFASALSEASEGLERVSSIVGDLREFTNVRETRLHPMELRRAIDSAINLARNELRQRTQLEVRLDELPLVMGNEVKLSQVFLNLLVNAVEATPTGAPLHHTISITATHLEDEGMIVTTIRDTGHGIPSALQQQIFEPFFTTRSRPGSGLGLAVAQNILHAHQGRIEVESERGKGATFRIYLQVAKRHEPSGPYKALVLPDVARARLLVIDDEAPILRVIERLLSREHDVVGVLDAARAMALIEQGERFDVIMCDVMMTTMDGLSFYEQLEQVDPELAARVIFLTGGALTEAQHRSIQRRDIPIVFKPFNKRQLLLAIMERQSR